MNKKSVQSVGVIDTMVSVLKRSKNGATVPQIVDKVASRTGRDKTSVTYTVRCQLSRLGKEKGVRIIRKKKAGELTTYRAA